MRGDSSSSGTEGKGTSSDAQRGTGVCDRAVPYLLKIRSGCDGGGKGPLLQEDKSATLATNNDQYLFVPMVSAGFKGRAGEGSGSIGYEKEKAPTIVSGMTADIVVKECMPFDTTQVTSPQNGCNPKWGGLMPPPCGDWACPSNDM